MVDAVVIVDYDPSWPEEFAQLSERAATALGGLVVGIEHIGSTAVPGLCAKPVIDLVAMVEADNDIPEAIGSLEAIGYRSKGDGGVPGREAFAWPEGESRHHLYVSLRSSTELEAMLRFRDRLRSDPTLAHDYGALKRRLAGHHGPDREGYTQAKTDFITAALRGHLG